MSKELNKRAVLDMQEAIAKGDLEGMFDVMTDDVVFRVIGTHRLGQREYRGKKDITENILAVMFGIFDDNGIKTEIQDISADGEKVFLQFTGAAKTRSGKDYYNEYVQVMSFRDGKICELVEYLDTQALANVLETS